MKAFHAYDIRGVYNKEFDKSDVYKIGFFLPELLNAKKVLVGRDVRLSSPEVFEYLCKGITDSGADVYDCGLATTPMVYWSTAKFEFSASVMITASHNSKEYNGLKVSREDALPVGYDNGLKEIEAKILNNDPIVKSTNKGKVVNFDVKQEYLDFQKQYLSDISNLTLGIDCSNGMAGIIVRDLLKDAPHYINEKPDGNFPGHDPNPLVMKNVEDLQRLVRTKNCDIGVIFDGDADRVMFVDENGKFVPPDLIIAVLAQYFFVEKGLSGNVLQDIRTSKSVPEYLSQFGSKVTIWKVGRAFAALKLREIDGIYGGELAGHYYFRDFYYSDSGMLACLLVLRIVSNLKLNGIGFSDLIDSITNYANSGEINFRIEKKPEAMEALKNHFMETEQALEFYDFDGYRIEFENWWFNIRPSNTEPYLRLLVECSTGSILQEKLFKIEEILNTFK